MINPKQWGKIWEIIYANLMLKIKHQTGRRLIRMRRLRKRKSCCGVIFVRFNHHQSESWRDIRDCVTRIIFRTNQCFAVFSARDPSIRWPSSWSTSTVTTSKVPESCVTCAKKDFQTSRVIINKLIYDRRRRNLPRKYLSSSVFHESKDLNLLFLVK